MIKSYTDCGTVTTSLNCCIQDIQAAGWVQGYSAKMPVDIEIKIERHMQQHTIFKEDIKDLFAGDTIILYGSNANSDNTKSSSDTITFAEAHTLIEELTKKCLKSNWRYFKHLKFQITVIEEKSLFSKSIGISRIVCYNTL